MVLAIDPARDFCILWRVSERQAAGDGRESALSGLHRMVEASGSGEGRGILARTTEWVRHADRTLDRPRGGTTVGAGRSLPGSYAKTGERGDREATGFRAWKSTDSQYDFTVRLGLVAEQI